MPACVLPKFYRNVLKVFCRNLNILDRFGSHLYNSSVWDNPLQRILTSFLCSSKSAHCVSICLYLYLCLWDNCMPCNLPVSINRFEKEQLCFFGSGSVYDSRNMVLTNKFLVHIHEILSMHFCLNFWWWKSLKSCHYETFCLP